MQSNIFNQLRVFIAFNHWINVGYLVKLFCHRWSSNQFLIIQVMNAKNINMINDQCNGLVKQDMAIPLSTGWLSAQ